MPDTTAAVLFARAPQPGTVKTRLAVAVDADNAARLHEAMARDTWAMLGRTGLRTYLATDTTDAWLPGAHRCLFQQGDCFGRRLLSILDSLLSDGVDAAVFVASDTPQMDGIVLLEAVRLLEEGTEVVFIPALDGGLALLALRLPAPVGLEALPWETPDLRGALRRCTHAHAVQSVELLPALNDLDELTDLGLLLGDSQEVRSRCPRTVAMCRELLQL